MIAALFAMALLAPQAVQEECSVIIPHPSGSGFTYQLTPGYSVANATPPLRLPEGVKDVKLLACARDDLVLTDNDFRIVLEQQVPIMIRADGIVGTLEMQDGRFRFSLSEGELTAAQQAIVEEALDRGQRLALAAAAN